MKEIEKKVIFYLIKKVISYSILYHYGSIVKLRSVIYQNVS